MKWKKPQLPMITILTQPKYEIKNNPQVYTTQEGIGEIKNNPLVYTTQEGMQEFKNIPQV